MVEHVAERLIALLQSNLVASGVPRESALDVSAKVVADVCAGLGGERIYLPRRLPWANRAMRDRAIAAAFDGTNVEAVCRRFGVSRSTVYRACKK